MTAKGLRATTGSSASDAPERPGEEPSGDGPEGGAAATGTGPGAVEGGPGPGNGREATPALPGAIPPGVEVVTDGGRQEEAEADGTELIEQPGKVMRIGSMVKQLLEEVRQAPLDEASRHRLREIYEQSVRELASALSPDLASELDRVAIPFGDSSAPSDAELRVAHAQLVGWLEGLFHGIQATLLAQQMAARAQLQEMRHGELPPGMETTVARPGAYL